MHLWTRSGVDDRYALPLSLGLRAFCTFGHFGSVFKFTALMSDKDLRILPKFGYRPACSWRAGQGL